MGAVGLEPWTKTKREIHCGHLNDQINVSYKIQCCNTPLLFVQGGGRREGDNYCLDEEDWNLTKDPESLRAGGRNWILNYLPWKGSEYVLLMEGIYNYINSENSREIYLTWEIRVYISTEDKTWNLETSLTCKYGDTGNIFPLERFIYIPNG